MSPLVSMIPCSKVLGQNILKTAFIDQRAAPQVKTVEKGLIKNCLSVFMLVVSATSAKTANNPSPLHPDRNRGSCFCVEVAGITVMSFLSPKGPSIKVQRAAATRKDRVDMHVRRSRKAKHRRSAFLPEIS